MKEDKVLLQIKENFEDDIKKKLNPLYDIVQNVHKSTVQDLKELFEAVGSFAYKEGVKHGKL